MRKCVGASLSGPGSREPDPSVPALTGFDPSRVLLFPVERCRKPVYRWQIDSAFSAADSDKAWDVIA